MRVETRMFSDSMDFVQIVVDLVLKLNGFFEGLFGAVPRTLYRHLCRHFISVTAIGHLVK